MAQIFGDSSKCWFHFGNREIVFTGPKGHCLCPWRRPEGRLFHAGFRVSLNRRKSTSTNNFSRTF